VTGVSAHTLRYYERAGLIDGIELVREGDGNEAQRLELLREHRDHVRARLDEVLRHLDFVEHKVEKYEEKLR
jgi:DNA-binding transcriptional MerR regulator